MLLCHNLSPSKGEASVSRLAKYVIVGVMATVCAAVSAPSPVFASSADYAWKRVPSEMAAASIEVGEIKNANSNKCLAVAGGSTANNAELVQYTCDGHASRDWTLVPDGVFWKIVNDKSGKCATIAGGGTADNDQAVLYTCDADDSRKWVWYEQDVTGLDIFQNVNSGLCMTVAGGGTSNNDKIVQYPYDEHKSRKWIA